MKQELSEETIAFVCDRINRAVSEICRASSALRQSKDSKHKDLCLTFLRGLTMMLISFVEQMKG